MDILENAKQQFKDKLTGELLSIDVPEWGDGGGPAKIFFRAAITLEDKGRILSLQEQGRVAESIAETLRIRALDSEGKRIFARADLRDLMKRVDPDVQFSVVTRMRAKIDEMELEASEDDKLLEK